MKYLFALTILSLLFVACKTSKEATDLMNESEIAVEETIEEATDSAVVVSEEIPTPDREVPSKPQRPYQLKAEIGDPTQRSDHYQIVSVRVEGNTLWIDVEYSGGCGWHKFKLIGSGSIMKSAPPQRSIKLIHDNDDDMCEEWVRQTIEADITAFAASPTSGSEIVLILDGLNQKLKYTFP